VSFFLDIVAFIEFPVCLEQSLVQLTLRVLEVGRLPHANVES